MMICPDCDFDMGDTLSCVMCGFEKNKEVKLDKKLCSHVEDGKQCQNKWMIHDRSKNMYQCLYHARMKDEQSSPEVARKHLDKIKQMLNIK